MVFGFESYNGVTLWPEFYVILCRRFASITENWRNLPWDGFPLSSLQKSLGSRGQDRSHLAGVLPVLLVHLQHLFHGVNIHLNGDKILCTVQGICGHLQSESNHLIICSWFKFGEIPLQICVCIPSPAVVTVSAREKIYLLQNKHRPQPFLFSWWINLRGKLFCVFS